VQLRERFRTMTLKTRARVKPNADPIRAIALRS
jgi:hypothetical protein